MITTTTKVFVLFGASILFTILVNSFHPLRLPFLLPDGKRPGIPAGEWNEVRYSGAREAFETVSSGRGILLDVRDEEEFETSHAAGAVNIPYGDMENACLNLAEDESTDRNLFILCRGKLCGLSVRVAKRLFDLGFHNLTIIMQDFEGWKKLNLPVEISAEEGGIHERE